MTAQSERQGLLDWGLQLRANASAARWHGPQTSRCISLAPPPPPSGSRWPHKPRAPLRHALSDKLRSEIAALEGFKQDQELALALLADNLKQVHGLGRGRKPWPGAAAYTMHVPREGGPSAVQRLCVQRLALPMHAQQDGPARTEGVHAHSRGQKERGA
jgi:hypothetical protein